MTVHARTITDEFAAEEDRRANGIPLHPQVVAELEKIADETDVPFDALMGR